MHPHDAAVHIEWMPARLATSRLAPPEADSPCGALGAARVLPGLARCPPPAPSQLHRGPPPPDVSEHVLARSAVVASGSAASPTPPGRWPLSSGSAPCEGAAPDVRLFIGEALAGGGEAPRPPDSPHESCWCASRSVSCAQLPCQAAPSSASATSGRARGGSAAAAIVRRRRDCSNGAPYGERTHFRDAWRGVDERDDQRCRSCRGVRGLFCWLTQRTVHMRSIASSWRL